MNHYQPLILPDLRSTGRKLKPTCNAPSVTTLRQTKGSGRTGSEGGSLFAQSTVGKKLMASLEEAGQREKLAQSIISKRQATEQDPVARALPH